MLPFAKPGAEILPHHFKKRRENTLTDNLSNRSSPFCFPFIKMARFLKTCNGKRNRNKSCYKMDKGSLQSESWKKILQIFSTLLFAITPFSSLALWPAPEMIINMYWQLVTMIYDIHRSSSKQVWRYSDLSG